MSRLRPVKSLRIGSSSPMVLLLVFLYALWLSGCSSSTSHPHSVGPAGHYVEATSLFSKAEFSRALDRTYDLAKASPPNEYTDRARVLRAVIFSGQVDAFKEMSEAYAKGAENTKRPEVKSEYMNKRRDAQQQGSEAAMHLAEVARQLTKGGALPNELTLDAPYPSVEGPAQVSQLAKARDGVLISSDDEEAAATDAQRKNVDDALGAALGGDRAAARTTLKSAPVKLDDYTFAVFLTQKLLDGAGIFDRKHGHDPERFKQLCGMASDLTNVASATLKATPDKDREKALKKLQDQIKTTLKSG